MEIIMELNEIRKKLKKELDKGRYEHTKGVMSVSYTHLDVYKRQLYICIIMHEHLFVKWKIEQIFGIYVCIFICFMIK